MRQAAEPLAGLTRGDFTTTGSQRRRSERILRQRHIKLLPTVAEAQWNFREVQLVDCSLEGIGLLSRSAMKLGEQFLVPLNLKSVRLLLYTVRHCRPERSRYHVGAEFAGLTATPSDADPQQILEALLQDN